MNEIKITLENCNNIKYGELSLKKEKLNVKYGMNGTGKSTFAKAIYLASQDKSLDELKPFGSSDEVKTQITFSEDIKRVEVFNEYFVNNVVFKESKVIDNSFDVFLRTPEYEEKRNNLDKRLENLKINIDTKPEIIQLREDIAAFNGKLELNATGNNLKKNTNYKAIIKKNNIYNIPNKLMKYSPIISDENICINWIDWKTKGTNYDKKGICPYCSEDLNDRYDEEKKIFDETYKKSDAQNLKNMLDIFEKFQKYIPDEKYDSIVACIREEKEESAISAILITFMNEYNHISSQLNNISSFDKSVYRQNDFKGIEKILENMKFEKSIFNFFSKEEFIILIDSINNSIDKLIEEALDIKISMGTLQSELKKTITNSKKDINDFLDSAGINYHVEMALDENGDAITTLNYIKNKEEVKVDKIRNHLSWGERNAFSLVLFMFDALSKDAEIIVLDDPISSFDTNKKYAIIHRLFNKKTGVLPRSFENKTVLMLTHDFEPIIDFGVVGKLPKDDFNAQVIKNKKGILEEIDIDLKEDIKPVVLALSDYVNDDKLGILHRIAFLRKYYEHVGEEKFKDAYEVLSSLMHGRPTYRYKNDEDIPEEKVLDGCQEIKKWINDFDYFKLHENVYNENKLVDLYYSEYNKYLKVQIFRAIYEIKNSRNIKLDDALIKFVNESYHIENDYSYYLDIIKFEMIPEYIIETIDKYMEKTYKNNKKSFNKM